MSLVRTAEEELRTIVNDPAIHDRLRQNPQQFQRLCASMDAIGDTELAIAAYLRSPVGDDKGALYLITYGALQALFVQQDALKNAAEAVELPYERSPRLVEIRNIRNPSIGHPANCGGESFGISRISLSNKGFNLYSFNWESSKHNYVDLESLIREQQQEVANGLRQIAAHLRLQLPK